MVFLGFSSIERGDMEIELNGNKILLCSYLQHCKPHYYSKIIHFSNQKKDYMSHWHQEEINYMFKCYI